MSKTSNENYEILCALVKASEIDFEQFQTSHVKACGNRVRHNLLNVKKLCDTLRKQILEDTKVMPNNKREPKQEDKQDEKKDEDLEIPRPDNVVDVDI